jgi:hypothetical protein
MHHQRLHNVDALRSEVCSRRWEASRNARRSAKSRLRYGGHEIRRRLTRLMGQEKFAVCPYSLRRQPDPCKKQGQANLRMLKCRVNLIGIDRRPSSTK